MNGRNFFAELKRRNVYKVAVAYAVVSWLVIQAASILLPTFDAPAWVMKTFVVFLALGFILSVIVSWVFDLTPEGIIRTADISPDETPDIVRQLEARARQQFVHGYLCALVYAGLGDKMEAIDYLKREYLGDDPIDTTGTPVDPLLDSLRGDPRFQAVADKALEITRPSRRMLQLSKKLRSTLVQEAPGFPAVEGISTAPITRSHTNRKFKTLATDRADEPKSDLRVEEIRQ